MKYFLSGWRKEKFLAIQEVLVPRAKRFNQEQKENSVRSINEFVSSKGPIIAIKLSLLLILIDLLSFLFFFRTFRSLRPSNKIWMMNFFFDSSIALFRKAFWGLNTLAKLGVYTQTSIYADLGYELEPIHE